MKKAFVYGMVLGMVMGTGIAEAAGTITVYNASGGFIGSYETIQTGVDACPVGGTVSVAAGIYTEAVYINKGIALVGAGRDSTTITAEGIDNINTVTFIGIATNNASISNFTITGADDCGFGITCSNGSPTITNNTISGNDEGGIYCESPSPTITNNTISGNSWDGIYCKSSFPTITNNTISGNNGYGIYCESSFPTIDYNDVWGNGNNYCNCSAGPHGISANPQFIGGGDYHLQATSPCIDKGLNTAPGIFGTSTDKDGNPRIVCIVDMGAYEYQGIIRIYHDAIAPLNKEGHGYILSVNFFQSLKRLW
jgi:parallel beta-helix repeat protein